ncbi:MAG: FkbM family methyltransferase [Saprospiraceae bacterium]|nr:FkbM family methyltransferase [Saprospiraceae bacterium]
MNLIQSTIKWLKQKAQFDQAGFEEICVVNGLHINKQDNLVHLPLLRSIFIHREYADYFPFYRDAVIIDVGAHAGYFSLFAYLNAGSGSRIIALEPQKDNYELLLKNLNTSGAENVLGKKLALSDCNGSLNLYYGNSVNHSIIASNPQHNNMETEIVDTIDLKTLMLDHKLDRIDFLKLDCEGAEYRILFSLPREILMKIDTISMEFHDLKQLGFTGLDMVEFLKNNGFEIVKFHFESSRQNLNYGKIIAIRKS